MKRRTRSWLIALGLIQGTGEAGLTVYRGIPYAAPPIGELRWRAPAPASWIGTLDASHFKPACVQIGAALPGSPAETTSEDCLGLNDPNGNGLPSWSQLGAADSVLDFSDSTHMAGLPDHAGLLLMDAHWQELSRNPSADQ